MKTTAGSTGPNCPACRHYFITWDPLKPYGCRALGFKSRLMPIRMVQQSTPGMNCQWFRPQNGKRRHS